MRQLRVAVTAGLTCALAVPAVAADETGYRAIAVGEYTAAARQLEAERQVHPDRPELMLNLAAAYGLTGRNTAARALYAEVLRRPDMKMDMPSGDIVSSHVIANRGLSRLAQALAAR